MIYELLDDLRFPIGLLFSIFSVILVYLGLTEPLPNNADLNLNLLAGAAMGVFGLFMIGSALIARVGAKAELHAQEAEIETPPANAARLAAGGKR